MQSEHGPRAARAFQAQMAPTTRWLRRDQRGAAERRAIWAAQDKDVKDTAVLQRRLRYVADVQNPKFGAYSLNRHRLRAPARCSIWRWERIDIKTPATVSDRLIRALLTSTTSLRIFAVM